MGGFTLLNDIICGFKNIQRWFHTIKRLYKFIVNTKKIWYNKSKEGLYMFESLKIISDCKRILKKHNIKYNEYFRIYKKLGLIHCI